MARPAVGLVVSSARLTDATVTMGIIMDSDCEQNWTGERLRNLWPRSVEGLGFRGAQFRHIGANAPAHFFRPAQRSLARLKLAIGYNHNIRISLR